MALAKCQTCGAGAVWEYMPADGLGEYCDAHVPRGCSCNREFDEDTGDWTGPERTDDRGRLLPCCEYWFVSEGFEAGDPAVVERYRERSSVLAAEALARQAAALEAEIVRLQEEV